MFSNFKIYHRNNRTTSAKGRHSSYNETERQNKPQIWIVQYLLISTVNTVERKYMIIIGICNPWIPSLDSKEEGIVGKIEAGVKDLLPKSSVIQGATYTYSFSN